MRNGLVHDAVKLFDQCRRHLANPQHLHACTMAYFQVQRSEDALQTLSKLSKKIAPNPQIMSLSGDIKKSPELINAILIKQLGFEPKNFIFIRKSANFGGVNGSFFPKIIPFSF